MLESKIYDLLDSNLLHIWKDEIEKAEKETYFFTAEQEAFKELEKALNENEKELLRQYSISIENKIDYIYFNLKIKILNFGIKIGMELEKSFSDFGA